MLLICSACHCRSSSRGRCCNVWLLSAIRLLRASSLYPDSLVSRTVHSLLLSLQELPLTDARGCPRQGPLISNRGLMSLFVRSRSPFVRLMVALSGSLFFPLFVHRVGGFCKGWGRRLVFITATESGRKPPEIFAPFEIWDFDRKSVQKAQRVLCQTAKGVRGVFTMHLASQILPLRCPCFNWQLPILQYISLNGKQRSDRARQHRAVRARRGVDTGIQASLLRSARFSSALFLC